MEKLHATKSELFKTKAKFLGHRLELQEGVVHIRAEEEKLKAIRDWPRLRCTKELPAFPGLAMDHWTDEHQLAFDALKRVLKAINSHLTAYESTLHDYGECVGMRHWLHRQTIDGKEGVIAYVSGKLPERAWRWPMHE